MQFPLSMSGKWSPTKQYVERIGGTKVRGSKKEVRPRSSASSCFE